MPDEHRLETLKMLTDSVPRAGWQLLVGAYPSISDYVTDRRPPNWRPWGQDGAPDPTEEECDAFISELERLLLDNAGADASRWADLVGIFSSLSTKTRRQAIELLSLQVADVRQHPALNILWSKLREQLHRHRSSYPNAHWAMNLQDTEALDFRLPRVEAIRPSRGLCLALRWLARSARPNARGPRSGTY